MLKRYVGCLLGVVILRTLALAAAHAHFPSFVPLFLLAVLFRDCLRMERIDSCFDDYAFPLRLADSHCSRVSRDHFSMKLGALGEDQTAQPHSIRFPRGRGGKVFAGSADDCAMVEIPASKEYHIIKTDCVVEDVHFVHGTNA